MMSRMLPAGAYVRVVGVEQRRVCSVGVMGGGVHLAYGACSFPAHHTTHLL